MNGRSTASYYWSVQVRRCALCTGLLLAVIGALLMDLCVGPARLSIVDVLGILMRGSSGAQEDLIIWQMRLPVALMASLVGGALALAGLEMQTILDNPLASPFTLGVSSAAAFGAALSLLCPGAWPLPALQSLATPFFAFGFSLLSSFAVYFVSKVKKCRGTILLTGIAANLLFSSLNSATHYFVSDQVLRNLTNWSQGNVMGATYRQIAAIALVTVVALLALLRNSWQLTALSMGDSVAQSLGVQVQVLRSRTLVLTALVTSIAVCFAGTIGFVGLVAPFLAKFLVGEDQRFLIPATVMTGSAFLSVASVASKSLISNGQIPIGIVTSLLGVPVLVFLIFRNDARGNS